MMRSLISRSVRRLWPRYFIAQVGLLGTFMLALGIAATSLYTVHQVAQQQHRDTQERLVAISKNLAYASAHFLLVRDQGALEHFLLQAASYPGLRVITITNSKQRVVSEVRRATGKPAEAVFNYGVLKPPQKNAVQINWQYGARDHGALFAMGLDATQLVVWHPIENGELGWLRMESSVDDSHAQALQLIRGHLLFALIAIVVSALALLGLLRPSLRAIAAATEFARSLTQARGQQIEIYPGNIELEQLGQVLNQTSSRLHAQEAAIRAGADRVSGIFYNVTDGIITWDSEGKIDAANRAANQIFGYTDAGLVGLSIERIVPSWRANFDAQHAAADTHQIILPQETFGVGADGTHFPLEIAISVFSLTGALSFIGALKDISQRILAENALRENELRLRYMLESCPTAARIARAGGHDVIFFNPRYAELINARAGQVSGVDPASYYAHRADYDDILSRLAQGEQIFDRLVELTIPGAGTKWALASYLPIEYDGGRAVLGWFHDITKRKQAEAMLRDHAEHTQAILDNMVDGIIAIDRLGNIISVNPAAEKIFQYTADEVLGHNVKMLMPNPHRDAHDKYLSNYHETREARIIGIGREVEGQRKDGSLFPMDLAISEITREGRPMYVGMVRDISERKRIEQMKTEFVSTVSHELRTPLTAISGALGLIAGGALGEIPIAAQQMVNIAHKNSSRLSFLINDLLDMEKLVAGKMHFDMQAHSLLELLQQSLESNQHYGSARGVSLKLHSIESDVSVRVDSQRFMQVLSNLLSNAIKYSPDGGIVEIAIAERADWVRVTVADHGQGIPGAFHAHIFQKFSQADSSDKRQKGGTGLGLAITRELVERMDGRIGFDSVEGAGASFFVDLPLTNAAAPIVTLAAAAAASDMPRILVVEDDPDIANLLGLMLTRAGYTVDHACDGVAALQALRHTDYAAMTLDLMLPGIHGLEVIRQVRQIAASATLPILVVSAKMEEGRLALKGDFSGIDWLAKPIDESRLLSLLHNLTPPNTQARPRVLHVEDDDDLHQVIRVTVSQHFDVEFATSLRMARAKLAQTRFDVVALDISLPDGSGWDLLPEIRARDPNIRVVILSGADTSPEDARRVEAVLLKSQASPKQLIDALNSRIRKR